MPHRSASFANYTELHTKKQLVLSFAACGLKRHAVHRHGYHKNTNNIVFSTLSGSAMPPLRPDTTPPPHRSRNLKEAVADGVNVGTLRGLGAFIWGLSGSTCGYRGARSNPPGRWYLAMDTKARDNVGTQPRPVTTVREGFILPMIPAARACAVHLKLCV
ncbi:hypothetical protein BD779DRAFT_465527 [Infundibulicybe gibba]|nr:hypothetical protein BD779DRAFT_465527 [Infundibulicybe gibba]